jgi:hypothetical protein
MSKYYSQTQASWTGVQVGTICMMSKDSNGDYYAPAGWQECNGRSLNPNDFYALYEIIGTTYGGDAAGSTYGQLTGTFNVPDIRDKKPIGTGRLRPEDASSPQLEGHLGGPSGYGTNVCGTYGGKNVMRISDVASRVQTVGNPSITLNKTQPSVPTTLVSDSYIEMDTGVVSSYTAQNYPGHIHNEAAHTSAIGGATTLDINPGGGETGVNVNPTPVHSIFLDLADVTAGHRSFTRQPHSHFVAWSGSIWATTSYHRSFGDCIGPVHGNAHLGTVWSRGGVSEWRAKFLNGDLYNFGRCNEANGNCIIRQKAGVLSPGLNTGQMTANADNVNFTLGITIGLGTDPDIRPSYQVTQYMIFLGVSADAYTAPATPTDTGDNVPDPFGPLNLTTTTAGGDVTATFDLLNCDGVYSFTVLVEKTGGSDVGATPINVQGTGTASNSGYVVGDTVSMLLEAPTGAGLTANYTIKIYSGTDLVQTGIANVAYAVAPEVTISAFPSIVEPGNATDITFSAPGATTLVSSNFGASTATGETISVLPSADTTYSVTVSNAYGSTTGTVTVTINTGTAPTVALTAVPSTVEYGGSARIQYVSPDATSFIASDIPGVGSYDILEGIYDATFTQTTSFYVTLANSGGQTTANVTLTVNPLPAPTVTFTVDKNSTTAADTVGPDAEVRITGADSVVRSSTPPDSNWDATINSGTGLLGLDTFLFPLQTTTYTVAATNASGTTTVSQTISVTQLPTVVLSAVPAVLEIGTGATNPVSSSTLTWTSTDATTVVSSSFGAATVSGTTTVSPTETTVYDIDVSGPAGVADAEVTVTVNCTTGTGTTAAGYGDTFFGYLLYNDGTKNALSNGNNGYFVQSTNSSYANVTAVGTFTYGQIGTQIIGSYQVILDRRPDTTAFDGWMNDFINNFGTTYSNLTDLNTAIYNDANGIGVGTSNELGLRAPYGGLEGNYTECGLKIV